MNLKITSIIAASLGLLALPLAAQTTNSGPVHFPQGYSATSGSNGPVADDTTTPASAPLATPAPAPTTAPIFTQSPVATPSVAAPATAAPSSNVDKAQDIRDIHGVLSIPYQWLWAAYVLLGLVVAVLFFAIWRWFSRRPKARVKAPYEIALDRLEAARALMTEDQVREYAFTVSEIIRSYIEQRFGERAAHRTTEEFLSDLLHHSGSQLVEHRGLLENFLNHCDLPKFARWQLSVREMESMHESARAFISDTRPQPQPAPAVVPPQLVPAK
jgi:hypothetical protein